MYGKATEGLENLLRAWKTFRKAWKAIHILEKKVYTCSSKICLRSSHLLSRPLCYHVLRWHTHWSNECHSWVKIWWHYQSSCFTSGPEVTLNNGPQGQPTNVFRLIKLEIWKRWLSVCLMWSRSAMMTQNASECNCWGFRVRCLSSLDAGSLRGIDEILSEPRDCRDSLGTSRLFRIRL